MGVAAASVQPLELSVPGWPLTASQVRRELRDWLRRLGATDREVFDIVLASGEAFANAVRHPRERRSLMVRVTAAKQGQSVVVTIQDCGRWDFTARRPDGGHGLYLMRTLTDRVEIVKTSSGTRVTLSRRLDGSASIRPGTQ